MGHPWHMPPAPNPDILETERVTVEHSDKSGGDVFTFVVADGYTPIVEVSGEKVRITIYPRGST